MPIIQTISALAEQAHEFGLKQVCRLDNVVCVVDSYRLATEFGCGDNLLSENVEEHDIENLIIQQIEFCNKIIVNKIDTVSKEELNKVKSIIKKLQPAAELIETVKGNVSVAKVLNTNSFDFEKTATSVGWLKEFESYNEEHEHHHEHECHCHEEGHECHCHEHEHDEEHECHCHEDDCNCGDNCHCKEEK